MTRLLSHLALALFAISTVVVAGGADAQPRYAPPTLYLSGDTLLVDLRVDSLLSQRTRDAIASGMTTSIAFEFLLQPDRGRSRRHVESLRLDHDIWDGRYTVTRQTGSPDSLVTGQLTEAMRFASTLNRIPLAQLSDTSVPYVLQVRSVVNPISPEQEVKTRRWLNLLERGSVLELFFSFAPKDNQGRFVEIARFTKQDLPSEVEAPDPAEQLEPEPAEEVTSP